MLCVLLTDFAVLQDSEGELPLDRLPSGLRQLPPPLDTNFFQDVCAGERSGHLGIID